MNIHQLIASYHNIRLYIFSFLSDYAVNIFLSCNHTLYEVKKLIKFTEPIMLNDKICKLSYYNSFTNIFNYGLYTDTLPTYPDDYYDDAYIKEATKRDGFVTRSGITRLDGDKYKGNISDKIFNHNPSRFYRHLTSKAENNRNRNLENYTDCKNIVKLPNKITHLKFDDKFNKKLTHKHESIIFVKNVEENKKIELRSIIIECVIPDTVQHLDLGHDFNQKLNKFTIPKYVTSLNLGNNFNQILLPNDIPQSTRKLIMSNYFNQKLILGSIPHGIKYIKFGCAFNQIINSGILPITLKHIYFSSSFNQKLSLGPSNEPKDKSIPNQVKKLKFDFFFNQKLEIGDIPDSVKDLRFGYAFNQKLITGAIPSGVKYLDLGYSFNQELSYGHIPQSVQHLTIGEFFNQRIQHGILPEGLTHLIIKSKKTKIFENEDSIPSSVISLTIKKRMIVPEYIKENINIAIKYI